jgi:hypothetical protein
MAHEGGGHAVRAQQRRLEREQAQHVVGAGRIFFTRSPRQAQIDGQTKWMVFMPAGAQPGFQPEVEVGRVDADEGRRPSASSRVAQGLADASSSR